jgi:protein-S-isoprenylcysteine O-methyltransferase Ste14
MNLRSLLRNLPLPPGQVIGISASILLDRVLPRPLRESSLRCWGGAALVLVGSVLNAWALKARERQEGRGYDLQRPRALVTAGPYALTRNPMYVGWWSIHLGIGILRGSGWVLATVPAAIIGEHRGVLREERDLAAAFPDQFSEYARRVPRYLPIRVRRNTHAVGG